MPSDTAPSRAASRMMSLTPSRPLLVPLVSSIATAGALDRDADAGALDRDADAGGVGVVAALRVSGRLAPPDGAIFSTGPGAIAGGDARSAGPLVVDTDTPATPAAGCVDLAVVAAVLVLAVGVGVALGVLGVLGVEDGVGVTVGVGVRVGRLGPPGIEVGYLSDSPSISSDEPPELPSAVGSVVGCAVGVAVGVAVGSVVGWAVGVALGSGLCSASWAALRSASWDALRLAFAAFAESFASSWRWAFTAC
ncbi:MAG: hypothetical protein JWO57_3587 [Pseudonocardiales bacterium]|nr:hypothetical protein [Pseudonocardiales bacterium]